MDNLETPYDEDAGFIECTVCDKSIRGETLYRIHLTTPGHIKKEDVIVAAGLAVRQRTVPEFQDILQYLDYLKLDEPIIGLSYLEEVPCNDPQAGPRYLCRLCHQTANLPEMVHHAIGRKHRQKYVELKRPDLVTWDKQSIITQGGKIIRARAEIIERQDGRGQPVPMVKRGTEGKLNISRVAPNQQQNRDWNNAQGLTQRNVPELKDYRGEYSHQGRFPPAFPNTRPLHTDEPSVNRDGQMYQAEDRLSRGHVGEEGRGADYRENNMHRRECMDPGYQRGYEGNYADGPQGGAARADATAYDLRGEMPMPRGQTQHAAHHPEEPPSYRRPTYPERDPLKEFYSEEVRRGRVRSAEYPPSQPAHPEDEQQWPLDRESGGPGGMNRAGWQGPSEPQARRRSFPTPMEGDRSHDHLFNVIKDYQHKMREPQQEAAASSPGPSRTGPPSMQRRVEVTRTMSDIPEPFRRFLTGAPNDEGLGKRKRKSRFSDATVEEVEMTKEMFSDECGPPNPKFGSRPGPGSAPSRPEIHARQYPDLYTEPQRSNQAESFQRGGSGSEGVFEMLKSIEIENAEEADFLKSKLCSLLQEFKSKKSERAVQNSQGRAVLGNEYSSLKPDPQPSPRHQYGRALREDSDLRRPQDLSFKDDHRGRDWEQQEYIPDERRQEYHHPVPGEPGHPNRNRYEEVFGWTEMSRSPRATHPEEPAHYSQRFQEPMQPRDYRPTAAQEYFGPQSSSPRLHMEQEPRLHRDPRYSKSLDKITSTLLELVARK